MNYEVFTLTGGNRDYSPPWASSHPFEEFFPQLWVFPQTHELKAVHLKTWGGLSAEFRSSLSSPVLCPVNASHCGLLRRRPLSPQLGETAKIHLGSLSLHHSLETLFRLQIRVGPGLTSFVSLLSGLTVLCCLISNVLKITVSHIWFSFLVVLDGWVNPILLLYLGPEAEVEMMRGFVYFLLELFSLQILVSVIYTCVCVFNKSLSSAYYVPGTIVVLGIQCSSRQTWLAV